MAALKFLTALEPILFARFLLTCDPFVAFAGTDLPSDFY